MAADQRSINDLIALIERNKVSTGQQNWYNTGGDANDDDNDNGNDEEGEENDEDDDDYSDVRLLIFAAKGPFTDSFFPMLDQHDLVYAVADEPEKMIDIAMNNPQIRHVLIDLDRPTNPTKGMNVFADLMTLNPNMVVYYCTKNPMSMESRNIQTKGARLLQKPILKKAVDQFYMNNFHH